MRPAAFGPGRPLFRAKLFVVAVRLQNPGLALVAQADIEDLPKSLFGSCGEDRSDHFDPFGEIAEHPVRRPDEVLALGRLLFAIGEVEDAGVFQESPDDRTYADGFRVASHTRAKTAEAANDEIDGHACLRSLTQCLDDVRVFQLVHLGDDAGGASRALV